MIRRMKGWVDSEYFLFVKGGYGDLTAELRLGQVAGSSLCSGSCHGHADLERFACAPGLLTNPHAFTRAPNLPADPHSGPGLRAGLALAHAHCYEWSRRDCDFHALYPTHPHPHAWTYAYGHAPRTRPAWLGLPSLC